MSSDKTNLRNLKIAAFVSAALHTLGAFAMAFVLSPGLLPRLLTPRMDYIRDNLLAWQGGWWLWVLSALTFLAFISYLRTYYKNLDVGNGNKKLLTWAFKLATLAVCIDIFFELHQIFSVPDAIAEEHLDRKAFSCIQIGFEFFSGVIANLLYSSATIISVIVIRNFYPMWVNFLGWATGIIGVLASGTALLVYIARVTDPALVVNSILFPLLIFWQLGIALKAKNNVKQQLELEADA
ncbi:MAG: hypothetical protein SFY67_15220 [Candidatus Melainabacteria bacterium]|nr:hypothetical protein [Candidatus Melainabacteria bacterium]